MQSTLSLLLGRQRRDGGWSAGRRSLPADTESTSLALLAVSLGNDGPSRGASRFAREWLRTRQRRDGSWPHSDGGPERSWMTSLAALALSGFPDEREAAHTAARWLLEQEGRGYGWLTKLMFRLFPERKAVVLNADLTGWPWYPDTFSWIEPTSYCLIALKALRPELSGRRVRARIEEAERMILDRVCLSGGWNYGNSRVLGEDLWPYPDTTALALIALQDAPRVEPLERSISALQSMVADDVSVLGLALSILALQLHGVDVDGLRARLADRLEGGGGARDTRSIAYAALALDDGVHPLTVPADG